MSLINVNKIDPQSGTALEIGTSGDTITVPTGAGLTVTDEVKTNKISPATGTAFTLGDSGDTFTVPSGATIVNSGTATGFGGGGKVLQVIQATMTSDITTTAGSFTDTGLTVDITPAATDSKILAFVTMNYVRKTGDVPVKFQLVRDSTVAYTEVGNLDTGDTQQLTEIISFTYLDSPSTTSATTYKVQYNSPNCNVNGTAGASVINVMEIGA